MALSDIFGINSTAGTDELNAALQAIQSVQGPTAQQLTLPQLQQYVQQGVLTPSQYQSILADPTIYQKTVQNTLDTSGTAATKAAIQQLAGVVQAGGSTDINKANLLNNIQQTNQAMQAARSGIMENAQERGVAGGGLEFMNQLANEQGNAQTANTGAVNAAANNAQLALNAMTQGGQLGTQEQAQANQMSQAQAEAAQQIAQYNSQLQSQANQYNVQNANAAQAANLAAKQEIANTNAGLANQRTLYNAQVPETMYNNAMQKANAVAGVYGNKANLAEQQAQNQAGFTGNLIGTGAKLGAAYLTGSPATAAPTGKNPNDPYASAAGMAHGGEVVDSADKEFHSAMRRGGPMMGISHQGYCNGGVCYAQGGEVHDHALCMVAGGNVPGEAQEPGDTEDNDTVPAMLSPHEIVLPRSVAQSPNAPQQAAQFVQQTKGLTPTVGSFQEALRILEENGLELRLASAGDSHAI